MANPEHVEHLKAADWNEWRAANPGLVPDLTDTSFAGLVHYKNDGAEDELELIERGAA